MQDTLKWVPCIVVYTQHKVPIKRLALPLS